MTHRVAVVGGGASGTLTAVHLRRPGVAESLEVTLHEQRATPARGVAYGTTDPRHLLNVRASDMSAFPDDPDHLVRWASRTGSPVGPADFLPRMRYADYLTDLLAQSRATVCHGRVEDVVARDGGFELRGTAGTSHASTVVLAYGNLRPGALPLPDAPWHVADPWSGGLDDLGPTATVVVVGSGLTAVDVAVTTLHEQPHRRVVMISRAGLLPRRHLPAPVSPWPTARPAAPLTADRLADHVREQVDLARADGVDWRAVVDGLRCHTQALWSELGQAERQAFLERHSRDWQVLRHRMAPEIAARLDGWRAEGRLRVVGGGLSQVDDLGAVAGVHLPGGSVLHADAVVNCTGPLTDVTRSEDPLITALCRRGLLSADPLGLGVACTPTGEVLDRDGRIVPGLHVVGPPRKGAVYETTAVPEIRTQAADLATRIIGGVRAG